MSRWNRVKVAFAAASLSGGLALAALPVAFAETGSSTASADQDGGMMQHRMPNAQGGMMAGMMGPMNSKGMQQKMARMMESCNRLMAAMNSNKDGTSTPSNKG